MSQSAAAISLLEPDATAVPARTQAAIRRSFDEVTRFELEGRKVIALGDAAAAECARHNITHIAVCHPSRRGYTNERNAVEIADAITALCFG
jgi:uroporphyrinogen-III synthase